MRLNESVYINTDRIILGKKYQIFCKELKEKENKKEIKKEKNNGINKESKPKNNIKPVIQISSANGEKQEIPLRKIGIGYVAEVSFNSYENTLQIKNVNINSKKKSIKIYTINEPENLKRIYEENRMNYLREKEQNIFSLSGEIIITAITKAVKATRVFDVLNVKNIFGL